MKRSKSKPVNLVKVTLKYYRIRVNETKYITAAYSDVPRRIDDVRYASATVDRLTAESWQSIHGGEIEEFMLEVELPEETA